MKSIDKTGELSTILGKSSVFEGNISVEHSLRVDGKVIGDIKTPDTLVVGKEGEIVGNVSIKSLILGGKLHGKVLSSSKVVLESQSEFRGEINTLKIVIDEGAVFEGKCSMSGDKDDDVEEKTASILSDTESE
jgi:cytoskeletal protein CcmA (bactofilin family)